MDEYKDRMAVEISKLSRNIFFSSLGFAPLSVLSEILQLNWLVVAFTVLFVVAVLISWITPGIFLMLGKPWLAHAWLRGINPIWYSATPWRQLSLGAKVYIIVQSTIIAVFASMALIIVFLNAFKK